MTSPTLFDLEEQLADVPMPVVLPGLWTVQLRVYGHPAPQGSKRPFAIRRKGANGEWEYTGKTAMVESSKKGVDTWRGDVRKAAEEYYSGPILDGCLVAEMVFTAERPKSHHRTGRNAHLLRDGAPRRPEGKPDLSKLVRSTEDALTGLVWHDDSRVVEYTRVAKVYAGEDIDALDRPGAIIRIRPLEA